MFKFYLNNGTGKRIQVIVWNDDVEYVQDHIKLNHVNNNSYFLS